jgi:hypothetical protein
VRAPVDHIYAPPFPPKAAWVNVAMLRMDQQIGRPVLIEFWDFCRPNSLRTLPYMKAWHERYETTGLRVVGVHSPGFPPSVDPDAVRTAVARLGIEYAVVIDSEHEIWRDYDNLGWPARYLFNQQGNLFDYHYGEGAYADTEIAIRELLGLPNERGVYEPVPPVRPEDVAGAEIALQSDDVPGPYSGPYEAGVVWAVLEGQPDASGEVIANGRTIEVAHPGAYELISHDRSTAGVLDLQLGDGVTCHAVCFTPGLA